MGRSRKTHIRRDQCNNIDVINHTIDSNVSIETLIEARRYLSGRDCDGEKTSLSMFDDEVVSFSHGEGVRRPYPSVIHAMKDAISNPELLPIENYMFMYEDDRLNNAISSYFSGIGVPSELTKNLVLDAGSSRVIYGFLESLSNQCDEVYTFPGFYHPLISWCNQLGYKLTVINSSVGDIKADPMDVDRVMQSKAAFKRPIVLFFNPNMFGDLYTQYEINHLSEIFNKHNAYIVDDALFSDCLVSDKCRPGRVADTKSAASTITVSSASKQLCLANMRVGWGCGPKYLIENLSGRILNSSAGLPYLSKVAAYYALSAPTTYYQRQNIEMGKRFHAVKGAIEIFNKSTQGLLDIKLEPLAGHSILLDFTGFVEQLNNQTLFNSIALGRYILNNTGICFSPAITHGLKGPFLRANLSSIGTRLTYSTSRQIERDWPLEWTDEIEKLYDPFFERSIAIIKETFENLLFPFLIDSVQPNKLSCD